MRILFVHNKYQYRGGEDAVLDMERSLLLAKGHAVDVLEFDNDNIKGLSAKIRTGLSSFYNSRSARMLAGRIESFKPDIIHVHNLFFNASPSILYKAKSLKIPVVMTIHNYRLVCANAMLLRDNKICELCVPHTFPLSGIKYKCYRSSAVESALVTGITSIHKMLSTWASKVNHYIIPSHFLKQKLQHSSLKLKEQQSTVIPNLSEDMAFETGDRSDYFLFVGRLSYEKGIDILVDTFANNRDLTLVIAGDGPEKSNLLSRIRDIPTIRYIGLQPKDEVIALMKKCKALIFPSRWYEGMPLTIIEALSTGTPVIAASLGAMPEMIREGYNGFLFPAGNSVALAERIRHFNSVTEGSHELYLNARQAYQDQYHPETHYRSIILLYETIIANSRSANV
jgi:glycosyltransferase involved in cell wall biosynthesis